MKHILLLTITLLTSPLFAGPYCMDNSEHLARPYDSKEWHSVACDCDCQTIKGGKCIECEHLQKARSFTIIQNNAIQAVHQNNVHGPRNVKDTFNTMMQKYRANQ